MRLFGEYLQPKPGLKLRSIMPIISLKVYRRVRPSVFGKKVKDRSPFF
jgi:hypothetical protein